jgi:Lon protease-like protein
LSQPEGASPAGLDWACLPIFPLGTVLFPGGALPLRVFEKRYVDMTRDCMRTGTPFGVCLIREGREVGAPAVPHDIGCLAEIHDWDMETPGVLSLSTRGSRRFRIRSTRAEPDGLVRAVATPLVDDPAVGLGTEFAGCVAILKLVLERVPAPMLAPPPHRFDDAGWVANRLAELLPIQLLARQRLMELENPVERLSIIRRYLGDQGLRQPS